MPCVNIIPEENTQRPKKTIKTEEGNINKRPCLTHREEEQNSATEVIVKMLVSQIRALKTQKEKEINSSPIKKLSKSFHGDLEEKIQEREKEKEKAKKRSKNQILRNLKRILIEVENKMEKVKDANSPDTEFEVIHCVNFQDLLNDLRCEYNDLIGK